jgi:hypothetical protein
MSPVDPDSAGPDDAPGTTALPTADKHTPNDATLASDAPEAGVSATAKQTAGPHRAIRRERDYTSAVYGSVLAATVVVSSGDLRAPGVLAILLIVSGLTFWVAHVYAATVAGVHGGWHYGAILTGMRHEWPVAFAAVPPAVAAVICGLLPNVSVTDGVWAALIVAIVEQQFWGFAAVRHAKLSGSALTKTVFLNVFMGLVIVALKIGVGGH